MGRGNYPNRIEGHGHHVLFYRAQWEAMPATQALRRKPGLIVPSVRFTHDRLHREVEQVPALSMYMAQHALQNYTDYPDNHLRSADSLMSAMENASRHRRATPVEIAVAKLAIEAVDLQRPFIRAMRQVIH